jgi:WD40 repeat protein
MISRGFVCTILFATGTFARAQSVVAELDVKIPVCSAIAFSKNGDRLFVAGEDPESTTDVNVISAWSGQKYGTKQVLHRTDSSRHIEHLVRSPDGASLGFCTNIGDSIVILSAADGTVRWSIPEKALDYDYHAGICFTENDVLVAIDRFGVAHAWNWKRKSSSSTPLRNSETWDYCYTPAFSKNPLVSVWKNGGAIRFAKNLDMKPAGSLILKDKTTTSRHCLSDDGSSMLASRYLGELILVDVKTLQVRKEWTGHDGDVVGIAPLRNGKGFLTSDHTGSLKVWDHVGNPVTSLGKSDREVEAIAVSDDNTMVAVARVATPIVVYRLPAALAK